MNRGKAACQQSAASLDSGGRVTPPRPAGKLVQKFDDDRRHWGGRGSCRRPDPEPQQHPPSPIAGPQDHCRSAREDHRSQSHRQALAVSERAED